MKHYKVIWFDDEYGNLEILEEQATINGIVHTGFTNAADGINELMKNFRQYDAVIIDAIFFTKPGQTGDDKKANALGEVFRALDTLKAKKIIPSFILSGQPSFTAEVNPLAELYKNNKVYDKQSKLDQQELWMNIKAEADRQEDTQIRHQFGQAFECCEAVEIKVEYQNYITDILKSIKYDKPLDEMLYFAQLRKIMEFLFRKAAQIGLLHEICIQNGEVNLSESSMFLSGHQTKHLGVKCAVSHFPGIIAEYVKNIIFITGAAVHTENEDIKKAKLSIEGLRKTNRTPFLVYTLVFQTMDIIVWFKKYIEENADIDKNRSLWEISSNHPREGQWVKGEITKIAENGYGTFQPSNAGKTLSITPILMRKFKLDSHQTIEVVTGEIPTTKTIIEHIRVV